MRDAVAAINPPVEAKELCRTRVNECIHHLKKLRDTLRPHLETPGWKYMLPKSPRKLADDAKLIRKVLKQAHASILRVGGPKFVKELERITQRLEFLSKTKVKGGKPWSLERQLSVQMAYELLELDEPCWRQTVRLTGKGAWYRLSSLFNEALTGEYDRDLSGYCRAWPRGVQNRLLLI
jgi:hypothetical protein